SLARVLLDHVRRESRGPADDEDQFRGERRITEVVEHPGDNAIDIDGDWLRTRLQRRCDRADEPHAVAGLAPVVSQAQHRDGARILAVHPMPEPGESPPRLTGLV